MKILSLKIENFMGYRGTHEIDFDVPDESPVILFLGENGHGKTTIQHAARWCLYNETKYKDREIPLMELLNRKTWDLASTGEPIEMSVRLTWLDSNRKYELTRTWAVKKETSGWVTGSATPVLRIDGGNPVPTTAIAEYVQKFLAKEISHFFFFNGEIQDEFDKMTSNDDGAAYIRSEIEKTLSIPVLTEAIEWLHGRESLESNAIAKANKDNSKIQQAIFDLEQAQKEKEVITNELKIQREKKQKAQFEIGELEKRVGNIAEAQELNDKMNSLKGRIDELNSQRRELLASIKDLLAQNVWLPNSKFLANRWEEISKDKLSFEKARLESENLLSQLDLLTQLESSETCPLCNSKHDNTPDHIKQRKNKLEESLNEITVGSNDSYLADFNLMTDLGFDLNKVKSFKNMQKEYDELGARLATAKISHTETRNKMELHGNIDVKDSMAAMRAYSQAESEASKSIAQYEEDLRRKTQLIDRLENEISKSGSVSPEKQAVYTAYRYLRSLFQAGKDSYSDLVRKQVETFATQSFNMIISDKKFSGLQINKNYGVDLLMHDGRIEPLRSTGQAKISAISLIYGLIKTAMPEGFILMDTPFGSLDMGHRQEVCKWATGSGLKVSLFMHSGEFDRDIDVSYFGNGIGRIYRISKVDDNESRITVEV
jgi:DNA sulfur modification protein DndD